MFSRFEFLMLFSLLFTECGVLDDVDHRINHCSRWNTINLAGCDDKVDFKCILSNEDHVSMKMVDIIIDMWDLENGRNCMRSGP